MNDVIITAAAALAGGAVGSIGAPFVNWGIEKRRETRAYRRGLIKEWREGIADFAAFQDRDFGNEAWYHSLHPYLRSELAIAGGDVIEVETTSAGSFRMGGDVDALRSEVARIEREWGLA